MTKMLAALYNGVDTVEIRRIERLDPGPGDALVRVRAEGICGSDLNQYRKLTEPETLPAGHETAGEIVAGRGGSRSGKNRAASRRRGRRTRQGLPDLLVLPAGPVSQLRRQAPLRRRRVRRVRHAQRRRLLSPRQNHDMGGGRARRASRRVDSRDAAGRPDPG